MKSQQLVQAAAKPVIHVHLSTFEGPFDLLIYLVERDRMDIYSISVAEITNSYLESLDEIEFYPELTSDFIYMAAYLLELKSRSLLPRVERSQLVEEPDPRQELIMRLVEYKRFKELAAQLAEMLGEGDFCYTRPPTLEGGEEARPLAPLSLDNLFSAFTRALAEARVEVRELSDRGVSIQEKIVFLRKKLVSGTMGFSQLTAGQGLSEIVATFLAVLELVRLGEVMVAQESVFAPIKIKAVREDAHE